MYRIIKIDGAELGMNADVLYIRKHENGSYVQCSKEEATGVAFHSTAYHLFGREKAEDYESGDVIVSAIDSGEVVGITLAAEEKNRAHIDYISMMSGIDLPEEEG